MLLMSIHGEVYDTREKLAMIEILNLGCGVQSSTVLLMSIHGDLPRIDHAIYADPGWEGQRVYEQFEFLRERAETSGVKVHRVNVGSNIKLDALNLQVRGHKSDGVRWASLPYFVLGPNGEQGQIRRQCTYEYKIRPIERCIRRELGMKPGQRIPTYVHVRRWYGISFDERQRMRESEFHWATNWYPLVERRITRGMCLTWMDAHGYHEPPRSACIGCPYRHNREWRRMKAEQPKEWAEAVAFDKAIRHCRGMRGDVFIHSDRKPLDECNLWRDQDENQLPLFDMVDECSGMCGV